MGPHNDSCIFYHPCTFLNAQSPMYTVYTWVTSGEMVAKQLPPRLLSAAFGNHTNIESCLNSS